MQLLIEQFLNLNYNFLDKIMPKIFNIISFLIGICSIFSIQPPLLPSSFQIAFDETFTQNSSHYKVNGQMYYDAKNNRQRVDRTNGRYSLFCGSILPNVSTSCTHLTVNNKRYIIFPQKRQCCYCCDSQHGCGIVKRNWLDGAEYLGTQRIVDTMYNKWSKDGSFGYNHFYVTKDDQSIPRRLDQSGTHLTDYLTHTFINKVFDDSYFMVPSYCNQTCLATSICGKLRAQNKQNNLKSI